MFSQLIKKIKKYYQAKKNLKRNKKTDPFIYK